MALNERSFDLILKAQVGQALQPLEQVVQRVKDLVGVLNQQQQAATRGETSIGQYAKALRDVEGASGDLLKQRVGLDALAEAHKRVAAAEETVGQRREARDTKVASLPAEGERSEAQSRAIKRVEDALTRSQIAADKANAGYARTVANLERIGVLTQELATHEERLAALQGAHALLDDYIRLAAEALKAGKATDDVLVETLKLGAAQKQVADQAARDTARFVTDYEKRKQAVIDEAEAIRAAGRASQAQVDEGSARNARRFDTEEAFRAEEDAARAKRAEESLAAERRKNATANVAEQTRLREAVQAVWKEEDTAREHLLAFEAAVQAAQAKLSALSTAAAAPVSTASGAVAAVAGPGRDRVRDVADTKAATASLEAAVNKGKLSAQSYNKILDDVFAAQRRIALDASLIDQFEAQKGAVERATLALAKEQAEFDRITSTANRATTSIRQVQEAENRLAGAANNLQRENTQLAALNAQLDKRRINTANLKGEVDRLVVSSERLNAVQEKASGGGDRFLGLSLYQVQNLSFQINDVITQLSLGQGVMRTLASQGGQIAQIFETNLAQMAKIAFIVLPAAAALGLFALSLKRLYDTQSAAREFQAGFAGTVDGAGKSSAALVVLQRDLEKQGVAFKDAGDAIRQFQNDLAPERIRQLTTAAADLSLAFGSDFKNNVKALSPVVNGTVEDLEKLLRAQKLLTPELTDYFETVRRGGRIEEARGLTLDKLTEQARKQRDEGISPLKLAVLELEDAYHKFLNSLSNEDTLKTLIAGVRSLTEDVRALIDAFSQLGKELGPVNDALQPIADLLNFLARIKPIPEGSTRSLVLYNSRIDELKRKLDTAKINYDDFVKRFGQNTEGVFGRVFEGLKKAIEDIQKDLDETIKKRDLLVTQGVTLPSTGGAAGGSTSARNNTRNIPEDIQPTLDRAAKLAGLDPAFTNQLYRNEAVRNPDGSFKTSSAGAEGPLQVLPGTFDEMVGKFRPLFEELSKQLNKPISKGDNDFNALAGALYYKAQLDRFGDAGTAAGAYNMGPGGAAGTNAGKKHPGIQGVIDNVVTLPDETKKYIDKFRQGIGQSGGSDLGGNRALADQRNRTSADADNREAARQLERKQIIEEGEKENGNTQLRIKRDAALAEIEEQRLTAEARELNHQTELDEANKARVAARLNAFKANQKQQRDVEDAEKERDDQSLRTGLENRYASKDPTNLAARIKKANDEFDADMAKLKVAVAAGKTDFQGVSLDKFTESIKKIRNDAIALATVDADNAGLDALVKERDDKIKAIQEKARSSTITLGEAATQMAAVIAAFGPKIRTAVGASNAALANVEQTPAVKERLARNTTIDPEDKKANADLLKSGEDALNKLTTARTEAVKAQEFQVKNLSKTQREADAEIRKAYNEYNPQIRQTLDDLERQNELYGKTSAGGVEAYEKLKAKIAETRAELNLIDKAQVQFNQQVESVVGSAGIRAFESITEGIGKAIAGTDSWSNAVKNAGKAFAQFVADVLKGIAEIILKEQILIAVKAVTKAIGLATGTGGVTDAVSTLNSAAHAGGIVGATTMTRSNLNPAIFVGAPRFHGGGVVGLGVDEVGIVAKRNEEVLTTKDPRHRFNGGMAAMAGKSEVTSAPVIKQVLVMNPKDLAAALTGAHGQDVVLTHIKNNASTVKSVLR